MPARPASYGAIAALVLLPDGTQEDGAAVLRCLGIDPQTAVRLQPRCPTYNNGLLFGSSGSPGVLELGCAPVSSPSAASNT